MSDHCGRNKVKTLELGSTQKHIAEAERRRYKCDCEDDNSSCSIESVYGNRGVPLQSAGDLIAFLKASVEQTAYNASLCKQGKLREQQPCINMSTVIKF